MSSTNAEIVRAIYQTWARGDTNGLLELTDPEIRLYTRASHPDATVFLGHDGLLKILELDSAIFEEIRYEPHEFVELGDHVLVPVHQAGRGKASGVLIDQDIVTVWRLAGGRAVESRVYSTEREALADLGLAERPSR
jgi:ketosteroid isomerase-like protein